MQGVDAAQDRLGPVADFGRLGTGTGHDLGADGSGVFGPGVVVGDKDHIGKFARCLPHQGPLATVEVTARAQHNVLLIIADDLGTDYLGFYEDHQDTAAMPNIRKLLAAIGPQMPPPDADSAQPVSEVDPLSPRELELLRLVAQGLSNQEIGERLFLALDTVKGHNRRIYAKLQVQRRTEAVARARELGLI